MEISADLVSALVADQFPQWKMLDVRPSASQGNDNRTFLLGEVLSVRLPSAEVYAAAVAKEDRALPLLSTGVSLQLPDVVGTGAPALRRRSNESSTFANLQVTDRPERGRRIR